MKKVMFGCMCCAICSCILTGCATAKKEEQARQLLAQEIDKSFDQMLAVTDLRYDAAGTCEEFLDVTKAQINALREKAKNEILK